jgi:hypothetical protein
MQCAACLGAASSLCSNCKRTAYCSPECQKVHWSSTHNNDCTVGVPLKLLVLTGNPVEVLKKMSDIEIWTYIVASGKIDLEMPLTWDNLDPDVMESLSKLSDFWKDLATKKNWPWMAPGWMNAGQMRTTNWFKTWFHSRLGNSVLEQFLSTVPDGAIITLRAKYLNSIVLPKLFKLLSEQFKLEKTEFAFSKSMMQPPAKLIGLSVTVGSNPSAHALADPTLWQIVTVPVAQFNADALNPDYVPPEQKEDDIFAPSIQSIMRFDHMLLDPKKCRLATLLTLRYILQFSTRFYEGVDPMDELSLDPYIPSAFAHTVSCTRQCPSTTDAGDLIDALRIAHAKAKSLFRLGFD